MNECVVCLRVAVTENVVLYPPLDLCLAGCPHQLSDSFWLPQWRSLLACICSHCGEGHLAFPCCVLACLSFSSGSESPETGCEPFPLDCGKEEGCSWIYACGGNDSISNSKIFCFEFGTIFQAHSLLGCSLFLFLSLSLFLFPCPSLSLSHTHTLSLLLSPSPCLLPPSHPPSSRCLRARGMLSILSTCCLSMASNQSDTFCSRIAVSAMTEVGCPAHCE